MAQDKATLGKLNPNILLEAENIGKKYKKKMSEHQATTTARPRSNARVGGDGSLNLRCRYYNIVLQSLL